MIESLIPILLVLGFIIGLPIAIKLDEDADDSVASIAKKIIEDIENHRI